MHKVLDARPLVTTYLGVVLVLASSGVLWLRQTDAGEKLLSAVKQQHAARGVPFRVDAYLGRCATDLRCLGAYAAEGWRVATPLERSSVAGLTVGVIFLIVGKYWNPALQASNRTQAKGLDMNALPARAASKPGWLPWV
jgi:hypothetical protein